MSSFDGLEREEIMPALHASQSYFKDSECEMNLNSRKYYKLPGGGGVIVPFAAGAIPLPWRSEPCGGQEVWAGITKCPQVQSQPILRMGIAIASFPQNNLGA